MFRIHQVAWSWRSHGRTCTHSQWRRRWMRSTYSSSPLPVRAAYNSILYLIFNLLFILDRLGSSHSVAISLLELWAHLLTGSLRVLISIRGDILGMKYLIRINSDHTRLVKHYLFFNVLLNRVTQDDSAHYGILYMMLVYIVAHYRKYQKFWYFFENSRFQCY